MIPAHLFGMLILEEEERREDIYQFNLERRIMRSESDPFSLSDNHFTDLYRLRKDMVHGLMQNLVPYMTTSVHPITVPPQIRIFAALLFYATGSYQRTIGQSYQLSLAQNTISKCINEVSSLIVQYLADDWIQFPATFQAKLKVKQIFMEQNHFPGCIGAIDCTHVAIIAPHEDEHNYLNRKGYHSKNVQIICDPNLKILNINSRYAGATHDAYIWRHSAVQEHLETSYNEGDHNSRLLGDSGYPQQPWLMTPVLNAVPDTPESRYNERHAFARNCVERCNGCLKTRFRCILGEGTLRYSPEKCGNIIITCAVLHNICVEGRLPMANIIDEVPLVPPNVDTEHQNIDGRDARRNLIERYFY